MLQKEYAEVNKDAGVKMKRLERIDSIKQVKDNFPSQENYRNIHEDSFLEVYNTLVGLVNDSVDNKEREGNQNVASVIDSLMGHGKSTALKIITKKCYEREIPLLLVINNKKNMKEFAEYWKGQQMEECITIASEDMTVENIETMSKKKVVAITQQRMKNIANGYGDYSIFREWEKTDRTLIFDEMPVLIDFEIFDIGYENNVLDWFDEYAKNSGIEMYKLKKSRVTVSFAIGQLIANSYKNRKTDDTLSIATTALSDILSKIPDDYEILKYVLNVFGEMTYPIDYKYINRFKWFKQLLEKNGAAVINRDNSRKDVIICSKKLDYLQYGSVLVLDGTARQTNMIYKEMGFKIKPLKNYHNYEARLKVQNVSIKTTQGSRNGDSAIYNTISEDIKLLRKSNLELNLLLLPDKKDIEKYYKLGAITEEQYSIHFQTVVSDGVNQEESMALNLLNTTGQNELSKYNGLALANLPIRHPDFYKSYAIALYGTEINISLKSGKQKNDGNSSWFESKKVNDIYIGLLLADILQIIHRANIRLLNTKEQCNIYIYSDISTAIQQLEVSLNLDFEKRLLSKTFETDCESYFKEAYEKFGNNHELKVGNVSDGFKRWFNRHWNDSGKRIIMKKIAKSEFKIHINDLGGRKGKVLILSGF